MQAPSGRTIQECLHCLISQAFSYRASDVHLEPSQGVLHVRLRIDGQLHSAYSLSKDLSSSLITHLKLVSGMHIAQTRLPQEGRFKLDISPRGTLDIRSSIIPTTQGESMVLRLLHHGQISVHFSELGLLHDHDQLLISLLKNPQGMIVLTGPTNSGKTTTLYSILNYLNAPELKITTLEEPIEYRLPGIHQVSISEDVGLSFASTLKAILRQSPDIIMIGEMRDKETANIAIHASITGHRVLTTLHTKNTLSALTRLIHHMDIQPFLITSALNAIIAQRLIRRVCPWCAEPYEPKMPEYIEKLLEPGASFFRQGNGCPECLQTGFYKRLGVFEILPMTGDLQSHIHNSSLTHTTYTIPTRTLLEDAVLKVQRGLSTLTEALALL